MKVLLITGGDSSERIVSLTSAKNVKKALEESGHKVKQYDLKDGYENIIKLAKSFETLFPVLHGEEGEGGQLHEFLNKIDKPIVGTRNYKGMQNGWYKIPFKEFATKAGLPTAPWEKIKNKDGILRFGFPSVLKATNGGSSHEVVILKSKSDLESKEGKRLLNSKAKLYIERYIKGAEITVGVLDGKTLPVIEIIPLSGQWFSYKNKYSPETKEIPFAPSVPKKLQEEAKETALKIHKDFNLGTYSRIDFMTTSDSVYVLEVNTIPGLTSESLMPKAAKASGLNFNQFLEVLITKAQ